MGSRSARLPRAGQNPTVQTVRLRRVRTVGWVGMVFCLMSASTFAQPIPLDRLPPDLLDATPPTARVSGAPGSMTVRQRPCRPQSAADVRRRIVEVATQEWGFFGFPIRDEAAVSAAEWARVIESDGDRAFFWRGFFPRLSDEESARVATSVAGYWAVTPEATMMVGRQNAAWNAPDGPRRSDPWSAAFISWVMCEAGLGEAARFQRAIAHHAYIDQAIRARQGSAPQAAFVAYDAGETSRARGSTVLGAAPRLSHARGAPSSDGRRRADALRRRREDRRACRPHSCHRRQRGARSQSEAVARSARGERTPSGHGA